MSYLRKAGAAAVCLLMIILPCTVRGGQAKSSLDGDFYPFRLSDPYVIRELDKEQQELALAVWEAVKTAGREMEREDKGRQKTGDQGNIVVGSFSLDMEKAGEALTALDINYFPFADGPDVSMRPLQGGGGNSTAGTAFLYTVDAGSAVESLRENQFYIDICGSIAEPYVRPGMSEKEMILAFDRALSDYMSYDGRERDPKRAVFSRKGACGTYAVIFQGICLSYGIPCRYVIGYAESSEGYVLHAWNQARAGKNWYYMDCCWNDSTGSGSYGPSEKLWRDHRRISYLSWLRGE